MGRNQSARRVFFQKLSPLAGMKTMLAKCIFCSQTVSASSTNMDRHFRDFKSVRRSVGSFVDASVQQTTLGVNNTTTNRNDDIEHSNAAQGAASIHNYSDKVAPSMTAI